MVECVKMDTTLIYTQEELKQALPTVYVPIQNIISRTEFKGVVGSGERLMKDCEFCQYCRENSKNLSEPEWYAFVTNMALSKDGAELADAELDEDTIFDDRTIELMAYAKKSAPAVYGKFKQKLKGKCSIKDFEKAVDFQNRNTIIIEDADTPLNLTGIDLYGAVATVMGLDRAIRNMNANPSSVYDERGIVVL